MKCRISAPTLSNRPIVDVRNVHGGDPKAGFGAPIHDLGTVSDDRFPRSNSVGECGNRLHMIPIAKERSVLGLDEQCQWHRSRQDVAGSADRRLVKGLDGHRPISWP